MPLSNNLKFSNNLFIANAVHEIRTPVQTIIGTLDLLSDTNLDSEQSEYVHQIRAGADLLLSFVNDFLDFSKLKSQRMTIENVPFDIKSLTEEVVHLIGIEAFSKNIEIVTDIDYFIPSLVMGDPTRIRQVLINLLKNAIKFTPQGYIHIELTKKDDDTLLFEITDSGIGIAESQQKKLFSNYFQTENSISRKYGGTGLGLALSRLLVEKMKGSIGERPNPYGGSIFWFTVPLVKSDGRDETIRKLPVPATTKVMIVDDSVLAVKSINNMLNYLGLQYVQTSTDPKDALLSLTYAERLGSPFDIVFIDMNMPQMDGWNLAREIKSDPALKKTKLYMLVPEGAMGKDAKMKLLDWFTGYIYKPVRFERLNSLLCKTNSCKQTEEAAKELEIFENTENSAKCTDSEPAKGITVLVAEDHPVNRKILVTFLKKYGAEILEAESGQEAVDVIKNNPSVQMVFMDIRMPVLNGVDAAKKLRQLMYSGVIIACTANNNQDDFLNYQKAGMNDFMIKPFKQDAVKLMIEKWLPVIELPEDSQFAIAGANMTVSTEFWDTDDFEDTIGGDIDLGKSILLDFTDQTKGFLQSAKQALQKDDFDSLNMIAHTIKGSSAAISANKLMQIGKVMNEKVKAHDKPAVEKAIKELEEQFELFLLQSGKWTHME